jgi:hypothetical protein
MRALFVVFQVYWIEGLEKNVAVRISLKRNE